MWFPIFLNPPTLRALAAALGLKGVEFLGYQPRESHRALWSRSLFTVVPSLWQEPFPLSFLESWAFQRAPVASRLGAMAEHITGDWDGFLVEPFSVPSLSAAIQIAIDHPQKTARMGLMGHQKLKSNFTREQWVSRISSVFDAALKV